MSYPDEFNHPRHATDASTPRENDRSAYFLSVLRTAKRKLEDALRTVDEAIKNVSEK